MSHAQLQVTLPNHLVFVICLGNAVKGEEKKEVFALQDLDDVVSFEKMQKSMKLSVNEPKHLNFHYSGECDEPVCYFQNKHFPDRSSPDSRTQTFTIKIKDANVCQVDFFAFLQEFDKIKLFSGSPRP